MANFNTHLTVATIASGTCAISIVFKNIVPFDTAIVLWILGTLGGILPDIDAPISIPSRFLFTILAVLLASLFVILQLNTLFWADLIGAWLVIYACIRYGLSKFVAFFTTHRGNFHSILAAVLFGLIAVVIAHHLLHATDLLAWYAGFFLTGGYLIHLLLDELYSIDFANLRLKKSFGSAFKIASLRYPLSTILLVIASSGMFTLTPHPEQVIQQLLRIF